MASNIEPAAPSGFSAWPRWVSLVIGAWLFVSAFVWPHAQRELTNTWIMGILIVLGSLWAMYSSPGRFVNTILALGLFFGTLTITHAQRATLWNNLIAAIIVFFVSLIPNQATTMRPGRPLHAS